AEFKIGRALVGEAERTRRAVEQAHAEAGFEVADMARHQSAREAGLAGGDGEGAGGHHAHKAFHGAEGSDARPGFVANETTISCVFSGLYALMSKTILPSQITGVRGETRPTIKGGRRPAAALRARGGEGSGQYACH